jgi:hypothetical protein
LFVLPAVTVWLKPVPEGPLTVTEGGEVPPWQPVQAPMPEVT